MTTKSQTPITVVVQLNGVGAPLEMDEAALAAIAAALPDEPISCSAWPEWMSVDTAARYLDVSPERLRKLTARRQIPQHQEGHGCRVFFHRPDLDAWMHDQRR